MNKEKYRETFGMLRPSDEMAERIYNMTIDKKEAKTNPMFKRILAVVLALVLFVCGGIGVNVFINKDNTPIIQNHTASGITTKPPQNIIGGVLIAYAQSSNLMKAQELKIGVDNASVFRLLLMDTRNKSQSEIDAFKASTNKYYDTLEKKCTALGNDGYGTLLRRSGCTGENYCLKEIEQGEFILDIDDYNEIESIELSNHSEYLQLVMQIYTEHPEKYELKLDNIAFIEKNIDVSGKDMQKSKDSKTFVMGVGEKEINPACSITYKHTYEFCSMLEEHPDFDLSTLTDTLVFTVNYKDGQKAVTKINVQFNADGFAMMSDGGYHYYK